MQTIGILGIVLLLITALLAIKAAIRLDKTRKLIQRREKYYEAQTSLVLHQTRTKAEYALNKTPVATLQRQAKQITINVPHNATAADLKQVRLYAKRATGKGENVITFRRQYAPKPVPPSAA